MERKPKIVVFAGPNGSGKSTITRNVALCGEYINADEIKKQNGISDLEAAVLAETLRETAVRNFNDFTFETVLSTERNLLLIEKAKANGYFIRGYYVLTKSAEINVLRVKARVASGGHDVPEDKIRSRYERALNLLPRFIEDCDVCSVYDNTLDAPFRIYKKYHGEIIQTSPVWNSREILELVHR